MGRKNGSYRKVQYKFEHKDWDRELDRLSEAPNDRMIAEFEAVLVQLFAETQAVVHVITGSLKLSGRVEPDHTGKRWRGKIIYGGESAGVNNPVKYAEFERLKGSGGLGGSEHDFMNPLREGDREFQPVIDRFLAGES
jgi:hypothetical protein